MTAINSIIKFQTDRELDKKEYTAVNEHLNIIEELLESVGFDIPKENRPTLELEWMNFTSNLTLNNIAVRSNDSKDPVPDDDKVDAFGDVIVFAVGAILKLGYDPELVLLEIGKEINSREGSMMNGKFEKDLSDEAKAKWYKANFAECKTKEL